MSRGERLLHRSSKRDSATIHVDDTQPIPAIIPLSATLAVQVDHERGRTILYVLALPRGVVVAVLLGADC